MIHEILTIQSHPQELRSLREKVRLLLSQSGFSEESQNDILVSIGEGCTNAIRHSYRGETGHPIHVTLEEDESKIVIRIRDFGRKIDLAKVITPTLPPEKPGGLGIYFMKTMMDQFEYNTAFKEGNELILTKFKK